MSTVPNILTGLDTVPITLIHYKGSTFSATITFGGADSLTDFIGRVTRIDDPDNTTLVEFSLGDGATVNGESIELSKPDEEIGLLKGRYRFEAKATVDDVVTDIMNNSYFIVQ